MYHCVEWSECMTTTTNEIFGRFEIRKSKKQRQAFRDWLIPILEENGYRVEVQSRRNTHNIVIGEPEQAKVIFTAHYDTCAVLPFPNFCTPKSPLIYVLYQIFISLLLIAVPLIFTMLLRLAIGEAADSTYGLFLYLICLLMIYGPANRHTANDNTSGVTSVIDLALALPQEEREKVAFILFDQEETGLIGSGFFAKKHKKIRDETLLINLDCVSDGETMLFCLRKGAHAHLRLMESAYTSDFSVKAEFALRGYVYPSDQKHFKCGVGVCALKQTRSGLLYMDRIHTPKDTVYREENIAWLVDRSIRLIQQL